MNYEQITEDIRFAILESNESLAHRVTSIIKDEVESELKDVLRADSLISLLHNSDIVRVAIREYFEKYAATEIGNRLRCGIYSGTQIDKLFESIWTEQLDKSIQDRIRMRVNNAVDQVIKERLSKI